MAGSVVLGASATINSLTGANIYAINCLLPTGIALYVIAGGLRSTFCADYVRVFHYIALRGASSPQVHTVIIFVLILMFMLQVFSIADCLAGAHRAALRTLRRRFSAHQVP